MRRNFIIKLEEIIQVPDFNNIPFSPNGKIDTIKETVATVFMNESEEIEDIFIESIKILDQKSGNYYDRNSYENNECSIIKKIIKTITKIFK